MKKGEEVKGMYYQSKTISYDFYIFYLFIFCISFGISLYGYVLFHVACILYANH